MWAVCLASAVRTRIPYQVNYKRVLYYAASPGYGLCPHAALDLAVFVYMPSVLWWRCPLVVFRSCFFGGFLVSVSRPAGAFVWVLGSRNLPASWSPFVSRAVSAFVGSGLGVASGGALGADLFALRALLAAASQLPASSRSRVLASSLLASAWCSFAGFPAAVRPVASAASRAGVPVAWGAASRGCPRGVVAGALLARSRRLAVSGRLVGCVAFVGSSVGRGSFFSLSLCARRVPVFVVCSRSCALPQLLGGGVWVCSSVAGVPAWRWLPRGSSLAGRVGSVSAVRVGSSITVLPAPVPARVALHQFS